MSTVGQDRRADASRPGRRLDIQGLRAVAVLLVVAYHAGVPLPGGFVGVDVFFVISGFVITSMLLREFTATGRIDLTRFYARRIRRLCPALCVMAAVTVVMTVLLPSPLGQPQETIKTAIGAMLLSANIQLQGALPGYFSLAAQDNALLHTWSLSVEEQFYLVFPTLIAVAGLVGLRDADRVLTRSRIALILCACLSFALVLRPTAGAALFGPLGAGPGFLFFSASTRAWEFIAGSLLALSPLPTLARPAVGALGVFVGLCLIALSALFISDRMIFPSWNAVVPVAAAALVIRGGSHLDPAAANPLTMSPLVRIGDWSYSWYLWHWPVIVLAALTFGRTYTVTLVAATMSLVPALLSYVLVEEPIRSSRRVNTRASYALFGGCVAATLAVAFMSERTVHWGWGQPWSMGAHKAMQRGCDHQPIDFETCTWGVSQRGSVLVAGDSQSWALADGVIDAASRLGMSTTIAPTNGCPFVEPRMAERLAGPACGRSVTRTLAYIAEAHPTVLVLANSEAYAAGAMVDGYRLLVADLPIPPPVVVIVRQPPGGDELSGKRSILVRPGRQARANRDAPGDPVLTQGLATLGAGVRVLDPRTTLCVQGACSVAVNGDELYSNGNHLSVQGATLLVPRIMEVLETPALR